MTALRRFGQRNILFLIIMALMLSSVSALEQWCYQEFADSTAECGNNGSYGLRSISNHGYFYINYSKPVNATIDSVWVVKIGTLGNISYSIPAVCWNQDPIQYEIESSTYFTGTNASCWNGTQYKSLATDYIGSAPFSVEGSVNTTRQKDGDYNTYILYEYSTQSWKWAGFSFYEKARIYEEAMNWQVGCINNWVCAGYGFCNSSDLAPCVNVTDNNDCNDTYTGDYSEFAQPCNYCSADVELILTGDCDSVTDTQTLYYTDNNWEICCNITHIAGDCPSGTNSSDYEDSQSCSIFDYDESDIAPALFFGLTSGVVVISGLISTIIVVGMAIYIQKNIKK